MSRLNQANPKELPCVWVNAGVLSYRPCHRDFQCESCELYQALQGPGDGVEESMEESAHAPFPTTGNGVQGSPKASEDPGLVSAYLVQLTKGCDLHLDLPYSPGHFWLREVADDEVQVGFDCQTLRILFPVEDFVLPKPGVWLKRGEAMGWIQRGHLVLPLVAPLSGEVMEVNHLLVEEIKREGFPRVQPRWLVRLKPHEPVRDVPEVLRGERMLSWYQRKLTLVREYLLEAADPGVPTGNTLNDGGELNRNLEEVLGSDTFQEMLDRLFQDL